MIFEFLKLKNGTLAVRLVYWDAGTQSESLLNFPDSPTILALETFQRLIQERLELAGGSNVNLIEKCQEVKDFNPKEDEYYSGAQVLRDLVAVYDLSPRFNDF